MSQRTPRLGLSGREALLAMSAAIGLWAAFPPLGLWPLAWIAPYGWIRLIRQSSWASQRPYRWLYLIGWIHWLLMIQWVRLPHWSAFFGWIVLSAYLAVYVPMFVACSRVLVHVWRIPSVIAVPIVWTAVELLRARLFTGFALSLLAHSQPSWLPVLQIADTTGAYGVSFLVMLVAACLERLIPLPGERRTLWPLVPATLCVVACWTYGLVIRNQTSPLTDPQDLRRIALIQGSFDTQFDGDFDRSRQAFQDYVRLSREAVAKYGKLDLVVWPESMFTETAGMVTYAEPLVMIDEWEGNLSELQQFLDQYARVVQDRFRWVARQIQSPLLVGVAWDHYRNGAAQRFNAAVMTNEHGEIVGRYDKMHPVMFGEYVPFGQWFPWLYHLTPMPNGLTAGTGPKSFAVDGLRVAPTICFENTVPHLMRRQFRELDRAGDSPDVLVTITNDGWFWGSSLLDVHLACGVFRAIELRRPLLIAANTGFSAWIDAHGAIRRQGPRRAEAPLLAEVGPASGHTWYVTLGDTFAGLCLAITLLAVIAPLRRFFVAP